MAPHGCEDLAAIEISAFRRISGGADMCRFPGLKKFFGKKLPNKILKVHVEKIAKTKNKLWLRVTQLESQPQISDHQKRKTQNRLWL